MPKLILIAVDDNDNVSWADVGGYVLAAAMARAESRNGAFVEMDISRPAWNGPFTEIGPRYFEPAFTQMRKVFKPSDPT